MRAENETAARRPIRTALKWILRSLLALALLLGLAVGGGALWLRSQSAVDYAAGQLPGLLKGTGLDISIDAAAGPLPQHLLLQGVAVSDHSGVWLKIKELEARVAIWPLLHGVARLELVRLDSPELLRLPDLPAAGGESPPADSNARTSLVLPVSLELNDLRLENASLAWGVLGFSAENPPPPGVDMSQPLLLNLTAKGSLDNGIAQAQADLAATVGPDLEARLSLPDLRLNLPETGDDSVELETLLSVKRGARADELTLSLQARDNGHGIAVSHCEARGMGLTISADGDWQRDTSALNAHVALNSEAQAPWQELLAELGGVDKQLLAALADPLDVAIALNGRTRGELNLDLARLKAGIVEGKGKITANINDWLADAAPDKAGSLKADLNLASENLAPLALGVSGPLAVNLEADGNMRAAQISLEVNSSKLETPAGLLEQATARLSGSFNMDERNGVKASGELKAGAASGPGGAAKINTAWRVDLPGKDAAAPLQAEARDLVLFAFGVDLSGNLAMEQEQSSAVAAGSLLWPQGLRLDGDLKAAVRDWTHISALLGMPASGAPATAEAQFKHDNGTQNAALHLALPALSLPETGNLDLKNVTANIKAQFSAADHNLAAQLNSGPGSAGSLAWSGANCKVGGRMQQGTFSLAVKAPAQAGGGQADLLAAQGQYDLEKKQVTLNAFSGSYPDSDLAARLRQPATLAFANGLEVHGLDLSLQPGGSLKADASIHPGVMKAQADLVGLPLAAINRVADTTLPPGKLEAHLSCQNGRNGPQGDLSLALRLDNPPGGSGAGAQRSPDAPDVSLKASLARAQGRLWLQGSGAFALLDAAPASQAQTTSPGDGASPLNFRIPMQLSADGLPLPDAAGPLHASLAWTGQIAPLWSLLPMPDQDLSGLASLNLSVGGSLNAPAFSGGAYLAAGRYEDRDMGVLLTDISLEAGAEKDGQVHVVLALADGKGGTAGLEGRFNPTAAAPLNLRGQLKHLAPLHRDDLDLTITGLVHVQGALLSPAITSRLLVERGEINLLSSLVQGAPATLEISEEHATDAASARVSPACDIQVEIPRYLFIRGRGLDSEWQGGLRVSGTLAQPEIKGKLSPVRGTFDLLSRTFAFDGGDIEFAGGTKINPGLNLKMIYEAPNLTAIVLARGTASKPEIKLESKPPLPQDEVLAQILFAKSTSDLSRFEALQLANGLRELSGEGEGFDVLTTMRKATGFDVLRVGSEGAEKDNRRSDQAGNVSNIPGQKSASPTADDESAPTLEAGKYINDSIYVGVEQGMTQEDTGVRVEIELFPNVSVQGSTSPDSSKIGAGWKMDY